jgi:hypothetical protein
MLLGGGNNTGWSRPFAYTFRFYFGLILCHGCLGLRKFVPIGTIAISSRSIYHSGCGHLGAVLELKVNPVLLLGMGYLATFKMVSSCSGHEYRKDNCSIAHIKSKSAHLPLKSPEKFYPELQTTKLARLRYSGDSSNEFPSWVTLQSR